MATRFNNFLIVVSLLICSCSPFRRIKHALTKGYTSIEYIHTSQPASKKNGNRILLPMPVIKDSHFKSAGNVVKRKVVVIPLIIHTTWNYEFDCEIGQSDIQENCPLFIRDSFVEEAHRSGTFEFDTAFTTNRPVLEIEIDSLYAKGPYSNIGDATLMVIDLRHEVAGPGSAYSRFRYRLRSGNEVLLEGSVEAKSSTSPVIMTISPSINFYEKYRTILVESLGDTFKQNIEKIVGELDSALSQK